MHLELDRQRIINKMHALALIEIEITSEITSLGKTKYGVQIQLYELQEILNRLPKKETIK